MLILADTHLAPRIWPARTSIEDDSFQVLKEIMALPTIPSSIILAGDIFDMTNLDGKTLFEFFMFCDNMRSKGARIFAVQGNHDKNEVPLFSAFGVTRLTADPIIIDNIKVCGLDWMPRQRLLEALAHIPECDLLVMHAPFKHLLEFEGKWQVELQDIPAHVKNVVSGDIHIYNESKLPASGGLFLSPGATRPRNLSDIDGKFGWVDLTVEPEFRPVRRIMQTGRKFFKALSSEEVMPKLTEACEAAKTSTLKPVLFVPEECADGLSADNVLIASYTRKQMSPTTVSETIKREVSLSSCLSELIDRNADFELYSFLEGALECSSDTLAGYLDSWIKARLNRVA